MSLTKLGDYCDKLEKEIAKLEIMNRNLKLEIIELKKELTDNTTDELTHEELEDLLMRGG